MTINLAANSCYGQDVTGFIAVTGGTLPYTGDGAFNLGALAPTDWFWVSWFRTRTVVSRSIR